MPRATLESAQAFRILADSSPVMMWATDPQGELLFVNRAYLSFFGISPEQVGRLDWRNLVHADDRAGYEAAFSEALRMRGAFHAECRVRRHDGEWRWIRSDAGPFSSAAAEFLGMVGSSPDVTRRVQAEAALRESEQRIRIALQKSGVAVWTADLQLRYTWVYNAASRRRPEDIVGKRDEDLLPREQAALLVALKQRVLASGEKERIELELDREGRKVVYDISVEPIVGADGKPAGLRGAGVDITERKRLEQRLTEADRRKDQALAMVAHELRSHLSPIINAEQVLQRSPDPAEASRARGIIGRQAHHLALLVEDLLDAARLGTGKLQLHKRRIALADVVQEALDVAGPAVAAAGHELRVSLEPSPLCLEGDRRRLCQAIVNLLNNAAKYTPRGGLIELKLSRTGEREATLSVRDNGIGVRPDEVDRIFGMFEQASGAGYGNGLGIGLPLARQFVEMHGGSIGVESAGVSRGSDFFIRLPLAG
jgi:PAS domain S-box-containing protein